MELQIAYKLFLGSDKDFENAKHLLKTFQGKLNKDKLTGFIKEFKVEKEFKKINENTNRFKRT